MWFLLLGSRPKHRWLIPGCECNSSPWDQLWNAAITCEESRVMFMRLSTKLHSWLSGWPQHPTSISFIRNQMPFRKAVCVWTRTYVCSYVCICLKVHNLKQLLEPLAFGPPLLPQITLQRAQRHGTSQAADWSKPAPMRHTATVCLRMSEPAVVETPLAQVKSKSSGQNMLIILCKIFNVM